MTAIQPTYLFVDTEWADAAGHELVSIALVSVDDQHVFYAERDPLPSAPTDFVRRTVYPLLDRGEAAMSDAAMTQALRRFLASIVHPYVLADHPRDVQHLRHVLVGARLSDPQAAPCGSIPSVVTTVMDRQGTTTAILERWFAQHPQTAARRHHALVDARALRIAWLVATGRISPDWVNSNPDAILPVNGEYAADGQRTER
ncbi:hypothetical protein [Lysobacter sp.]|uniref:hypothetical protein n=1 Tax=Lysobacter sp. TaxID=72226 RepID=UPI002D42A1DD|nr:hypothetical protein [Lysobacter sp.]HZX78219.1 hypothetical protein [Lysobacter sp.]